VVGERPIGRHHKHLRAAIWAILKDVAPNLAHVTKAQGFIPKALAENFVDVRLP
jgi:hypothetical protein